VATETLRRVACDCGVVRHLLRGASQPLDVGIRTSVRTAASGGPSPFGTGGRTAVDNGILICPRHHTAVHEGGSSITGEANGTLTFHRPDGSILGTSTAASDREGLGTVSATI
jgi:hypothetical protein